MVALAQFLFSVQEIHTCNRYSAKRRRVRLVNMFGGNNLNASVVFSRQGGCLRGSCTSKA